jgi:hypothetical protein
MRVHDLLVHLQRHYVLLAREGSQVQVRALFQEHPLSPGTLALVREHKDGLLEYLAWTEEADLMLLSSTRFLGREWPEGCELDGEEWERLEAELQQAYLNQDRDELRAVIRRREDHALDLFSSFSREGAA